jgi:hypothetical protein
VITRDSTVVASASQVSNTVEGEAVILELGRGTYYGLDPVGTRVWSLIQEPRRAGDICDELVAEYEVAAARCEQDVLALLEKLAENGLLDVVA